MSLHSIAWSPMKVCKACGIEKPHDDFYKWQRKCKACVLTERKPYYVANKERLNATTRRWKAENPDRVRSTARIKKYGTDGQDLWKSQRGMCAICSKDLSAERVRDVMLDHCHQTGRVRGWLCRRCNSALGLFCDSPERVRAALEYLSRNPGL